MSLCYRVEYVCQNVFLSVFMELIKHTERLIMITWFREASLDILTQFIQHDDLHPLTFIGNDTNQANYYVFQEGLNYRVKAVRWDQAV